MSKKIEKETKTKVKDVKIKKEKKIKVKKESFFKGVRKEMKKVRWPLKKEMTKYSVAALTLIVFFALYFMLGDLVIAGVKVLVG